MVRFKHPSDENWIRKPAVKGGNGRWLAGKALFKDKKNSEISVEEIGENYSFEVRVEDGGTTYKPVGRKADDAGNKFLEIANKAAGRTAAERVGLVVTDRDSPKLDRTKLEDAFESYIRDAESARQWKPESRLFGSKKSFSDRSRSHMLTRSVVSGYSNWM